MSKTQSEDNFKMTNYYFKKSMDYIKNFDINKKNNTNLPVNDSFVSVLGRYDFQMDKMKVFLVKLAYRPE